MPPLLPSSSDRGLIFLSLALIASLLTGSAQAQGSSHSLSQPVLPPLRKTTS